MRRDRRQWNRDESRLAPSEPRAGKRYWWFALTLRSAKFIFTPVAIVALVYAVWISRDTLSAMVASASGSFVVLTATLWLSLHFVGPVFTFVVLRALDARMSYRDVLGVHLGRLPARYLPGGVWHTVARLIDFGRIGITKRQLATLFYFEVVLPPLFTLTIGGFGVVALPAFAHMREFALPVFLMAGAGLIVAPYLPGRVVSRHASSLPLSAYMQLLVLMALFWALAATAFLCYAFAFGSQLEVIRPLEFTLAYLFSYGVGYLALFAPQGLGVSEFMMTLLMDWRTPLAVSVTLLAGFRVVSLLADLLAWGGWLVCRRVLWPKRA